MMMSNVILVEPLQKDVYNFIRNTFKKEQIEYCKFDEKLAKNKSIQFIILGCDYKCCLPACSQKFIYILKNPKTPFLILRPNLYGVNHKVMPKFYLSIFKNKNLTSVQKWIIEELYSSKYLTGSVIHHSNSLNKLAKVQRIVVENFKKEMNLSSLAREVNLSPSWLSNRFKKEFDISLKRFIISITLCSSLWEIICTDKLIKTIAIESNYKPLSFSKRFHENFGIPPSFIRKEFDQF